MPVMTISRPDSAGMKASLNVIDTVRTFETVDAAAGVDEIYVCGGSAAYALAMSHADRLLVTHVSTRLGSGVPFPTIETPPWKLVSSTSHPADAENIHAMRFADYRRG